MGLLGPSGFTRMIPDRLAVSGTSHAVTCQQSHAQLGKHVGVEDTHFGNVPDGCGLSYVSNDTFSMALSLGSHQVQLVQQIGCTCRGLFWHDGGSFFPQSSWKQGPERGEGSTSDQGP